MEFKLPYSRESLSTIFFGICVLAKPKHKNLFLNNCQEPFQKKKKYKKKIIFSRLLISKEFDDQFNKGTLI